MTLGIVNINLCVTSKLPIIKNTLPCDDGISCRHIFTVQVNKHQCKLFLMCSFFNNLFTVSGNDNIINSKNRIITEIIIPNYQSLFFFKKLTQLA